MAIVAAAATLYSVYQTNEARKEQRRAGNEQRAQNKAESMRERRNQIREQRIREAAILQSSQASGTTGSSGEIGALGNISTNLADNISTNIGRLQTAQNISIFQQRAADAMNRAETARAIAGASGQFVSQSGKK